MTHLLHATHSKEGADITSNTHKLDADMGALLDDLVSIVCILRRRSIGVKLDIRGNKLMMLYQQATINT